MRKSLSFFTFLFAASILLYSCKRCSCNCDYGSRCRILTVNDTAGKIKGTKLYCTSLKYEDIRRLEDSVAAFKGRHQTDTTTVTERDSLSVEKRVADVKCNRTQGLEVAGYHCECAK